MKANTRRVDAGDVILHSWGCCKRRPWLVLWVDDDYGEVCVVPITSKHDYVGTIPTGHDEFAHVGAWAMVQPLALAARASPICYIDRRARRRITKALHENIGLGT
tara:strand:+ start:37 stop:351 length:315 start_codon:yes stop_codon:yes gene_type:complete